MTETYTPSMLVQSAHDANRAAEDSIKAKQEAEIYKEDAKDVLAQIMTDIKASEEVKISEAELERRARSSPEWKEFREEQYAAIKESIQKTVIAQNKRLYFDALQSALSYQKAEFSRLGGEP